MAGHPKILISASVYDKEELLEQVYATLTGLGYEVWMSHTGILPVNPALSAFENCLKAVEDCDLFLGIISGFYGTGVEKGIDSITHQELSKAISLNKLRWFLVDRDVLVVRNFVKSITKLEEDEKLEICSKLNFKGSDPITDMRVLKMYEEATQLKSGVALAERAGNWVQQFENSRDVLQFIKFQLGDPHRYISQS